MIINFYDNYNNEYKIACNVLYYNSKILSVKINKKQLDDYTVLEKFVVAKINDNVEEIDNVNITEKELYFILSCDLI